MLARTPLTDLAVAWLETQDPDQRYDWGDHRRCACAQLARAIGRYGEWVRDLRAHKTGWRELNDCAKGGLGAKEWTFGKFLARLRT